MSQKTPILESREAIAQLDASNMLGSIEALDKQIEHAWHDLQAINFTPSAPIRNVVVAGMGGSAIGADVILHLFKDSLSVPLTINRTYSLPAFVDEHTLVILSSYSGTTEETVASAHEAIEKNAQIMVIAAGGTLVELAKEHSFPLYQIDPQHNPSGQPRMAIGYSVFGTIGLLAKAGLLSVTNEDIAAVTAAIKTVAADCAVEVTSESNPAKTLAYTMIDRQPYIVVAEFLEGAAHVSANQHNENAKAFVNYKVVPEINHHLMEGLRFPTSNQSTHFFIFVQSVLYPPQVSIRMRLTQNTIEENNIDTTAIPLQAKNKLAQTFECIAFFSYVSFYLAMLEGIDPSPIPFVDAFKAELSKQAKAYQA